jgi:hypothetical protein
MSVVILENGKVMSDNITYVTGRRTTGTKQWKNDRLVIAMVGMIPGRILAKKMVDFADELLTKYYSGEEVNFLDLASMMPLPAPDIKRHNLLIVLGTHTDVWVIEVINEKGKMIPTVSELEIEAFFADGAGCIHANFMHLNGIDIEKEFHRATVYEIEVGGITHVTDLRGLVPFEGAIC